MTSITLVLNLDEFIFQLPKLKRALWEDSAKKHTLELSDLFLMTSFDANHEKQEKLMREYPKLAPYFDEVNTQYAEERLRYSQKATLNSELISLLSELSNKVNIVACTNLPLQDVVNHPLLENLPFHIHEIFSTKDVFSAKPDADIYLKIARKLKLPASKLITLDATINGVQAGYLAHTKAIFIAEHFAINQAIQEYATAFLNDFTELKTTLNTWLINQNG